MDIFKILSPFKSQNLHAGIIYQDDFVLFSFGSGLSAHLKLTLNSGDQKVLIDLY